MHGHDEKNQVRQDVWDLNSVVELVRVKASSFNRLVPKFTCGNADQSTSNIDAHDPETHKSKHCVYRKVHGSNCKQSLVKCQDGKLDKSDAASIHKVVRVSDLITVNAGTRHVE